MRGRRGVCLAAILVVSSCRLSPLTNRLAVGQQPFVVFVAEGPGGGADLFAGPAEGGELIQLTFTRPAERAPALHPAGTMVAFLRDPTGGSTPGWLVVMNLLNAAEREVPLEDAGAERVAWSADGQTLFVGGETAAWATPSPPGNLSLRRVPPESPLHAVADSALAVLLGSPAIASAVACDSLGGAGVCAGLPDGRQQLLSAEGDHPFRWGGDSVAYFAAGLIEVRPLGGGRTRRVEWTSPVLRPRQGTYYGGSR